MQSHAKWRGYRIETELRPGDLGEIVRMHGALYAQEYGFDTRFEAYVAAPLAQCIVESKERERIWLAFDDNGLAGCIAIVEHNANTAQLRWYLVHPRARGAGLGRHLLDLALQFCRANDYDCVMLWTVSALKAAARLYTDAGFRRVERKADADWGADVMQEKYILKL